MNMICLMCGRERTETQCFCGTMLKQSHMTPKEALDKLFPQVLDNKKTLSMEVTYKGQLIRLTLENITKESTTH